MTSEAIQQLADAIRNQTRDSQVAAVSFKAPSFWNTNAAAWFVRLEAAFSTNQPPITNDTTRFHHVVQLLDSETSRRVLPVLQHPPASGKYPAIKQALLKAFEQTQFQKDSILLNMNGLGDRRPTELLQYMRALNSDPATIFRALFLHQLPPEVRRTIATSSETDLDTLAEAADRIMEADSSTSATPLVTATSADTAQDVSVIKSPPAQPFRKDKYVLCKYHTRYGPKARSCEKVVNGRPCPMFKESGNE